MTGDSLADTKTAPLKAVSNVPAARRFTTVARNIRLKIGKGSRKTCGKKVSPESANKVSPEFSGTPSFHQEYRASYPADRDGFSTLLSAFMGIQMANSPLQQEESILDPFGTAGRILAKRWDFDLSFEPGILDFLKREKPSPGEIWQTTPD